jgi:small acid-soluble spore protein A (major alpha-type SASP)
VLIVPKPFLKGVLDMARNKLLVPGAENALNSMKEEIANELGVELGADTTARANGSVGGEMTKRLVALAENQLQNQKQ